MYHGHLDDIGSRALDGGVDGVALGKATYSGVLRVDIGQVAATAEEGSDVALLARHLFRLLHVVVHLWEGVEVAVNQHLSLVARDVEALGQAKHGDAVDDAEVGTFRLRSLVARHLFNGFFIDVGGRGSMQVLTFAEHAHHVLVLRQMGHHAQFNLTVVC